MFRFAVWTRRLQVSPAELVSRAVSPNSDARASVKIWTELDGTPVPVTFDSNGDGVFDDPDDGRVVFANRDFQITSLITADILKLFLNTRSANAFNWVAMNVGSGIHSLVVKSQLDVQVTGAGLAKAAVGRRTLVAEPAKLSNDATVLLDPPAEDVPPSALLGLQWGAVGPNPFHGTLDLELRAGRSGPATVGVYDVGGHRVAKLFDGTLSAGRPRLRWDGLDATGNPAPPGVYLVRAKIGEDAATKRVCLLR